MRRLRSLVRLVAALSWGCLTLAAPALAHESNGTPAAKALFAQGDAAARAGKPADAAAAYRKAADADPDYVDAHQRFIETTQRAEQPGSRTPSVPRLLELYARWAREQPKRAVYQWALGFLTTDADKADEYFRAALSIDPSFARAHFLLARNADIRGDFAAQRAHLKNAVESNPDEPRYLLKYAQAHKRVDPPRFKALALSVVERFPASPSAAEALYSVADASENPERRALFERLRATYPPDKFSYGATAMYDFYDEVTVPSEALSIAQEMAKAQPASRMWARRVALQQAMTSAEALVKEHRFAEALDLLDKTERPSGNHGTTWTLLTAEAAAGAGRVDQAYAALVESTAAAHDDRLKAAAARYAAALNKTPADVDADVWQVRDAKAVPAAPFELPADRGEPAVKLSDYRGRLVLLAFWFPG
jgi:tetratricopeptide (TPR) repeat protein